MVRSMKGGVGPGRSKPVLETPALQARESWASDGRRPAVQSGYWDATARVDLTYRRLSSLHNLGGDGRCLRR